MLKRARGWMLVTRSLKMLARRKSHSHQTVTNHTHAHAFVRECMFAASLLH